MNPSPTPQTPPPRLSAWILIFGAVAIIATAFGYVSGWTTTAKPSATSEITAFRGIARTHADPERETRR